MERFELAETEKDREIIRKRYKAQGFDDLKINMLLSEDKDFNRNFGLTHEFKELDSKEEEKIDLLFEKREELVEKYAELYEQFQIILNKEYNIWKEIREINNKICEMEGHRLEEKSEEMIDDDGYGGFISFGFSRRCLVCGKRVNERDIKPEDVVVKGTAESIERPKIKTKKIKS